MIKYKDSGIEWVGEIPADWKTAKLNHIADFASGGTPDTDNLNYWDYSGSGIPWVAIGDMSGNRDVISSTKKHLTEQGFSSKGLRIFPCGTILFAMYASVGEVAKLGIDATCNQALLGITPTKICDSQFLFYTLKAIKSWLPNVYRSNTQHNLNASQVKDFRVPLPPLATQQKIVAFLDAETVHIDAGIANMESLITLLTEKRSALISEVVTRGIPGEHTEFKDSGVEWLGEIPEGWEVKRIGSLFRNRSEKVSDKDFPALSVTKKGIVPQLSNAAKTDDGDNRKKILQGDFVINSRSDRKGSSGISPLDGSTSLISTVLEPNGQLVSDYIHHLMRSVDFQEEYYRYGRGIVADLWTTRFSDMSSIYLPVPPIEEQGRIVVNLFENLESMDKIIRSANSAKSLLKEKRQTLISDVVTGNIDVT